MMPMASLSLYRGASIQTAARVRMNAFEESFLQLTVFERVEGGWEAETLELKAQMKTPETPVARLPAEAVPLHGFRMDIYRPVTGANVLLSDEPSPTSSPSDEEGEGEDGDFDTFSEFLRMEQLQP